MAQAALARPPGSSKQSPGVKQPVGKKRPLVMAPPREIINDVDVHSDRSEDEVEEAGVGVIGVGNSDIGPLKALLRSAQGSDICSSGTPDMAETQILTTPNMSTEAGAKQFDVCDSFQVESVEHKMTFALDVALSAMPRVPLQMNLDDMEQSRRGTLL